MKRHASKMYSVFIASVLSVTLLPTSAFAEITDDSAPNFELDKDNEQGEFSENYWHEYDDKPENKEQSEYGQATEEIIENVENNIQIEYAEENTSEYEKNDYELFDTYTENSVITINNTSELIDAIKNQKDGQTWIIASGEYDVTEVFNGQSGSCFIIEKDNITIEAYDKNNKPVIYGFSSAASGTANGINGQNTITVSGNNCTIKDLKIMPLAGFGSNTNQYQKALEVTGNDSFTLMGCEFMENTFNHNGENNLTEGYAGRVSLNLPNGNAETVKVLNNIFTGAVLDPRTPLIAKGNVFNGVSPVHKMSVRSRFQNGTAHKGTVISDNKFLNIPHDGTAVYAGFDSTGKVEINASGNYWGTSLISEILNKITGNVIINSYYSDENMNELETIEGTLVTNGEELKNEIKNAENGDVITFINDITLNETITVDKSITINGNGFSLIGDNTKLYSAFEILSGEFTIENIKIKEFGGMREAGSYAVIKVPANAEETVLTALNVEVTDFNRTAFDIRSGKFEITDCYINCENSYSKQEGTTKVLTKGILAGMANSVVKGTVLGTTIETSESRYDNWSSGAIELYYNSDVAIKDSSILNVQTGIWLDNYYAFDESQIVSAVIENTVIKASDDAVRLYSTYNGAGGKAKASVDILSGDFTGNIRYIGKTNNDSITVKGGLFSADPTEFLDEGYLVEEKDGKFLVLQYPANDDDSSNGDEEELPEGDMPNEDDSTEDSEDQPEDEDSSGDSDDQPNEDDSTGDSEDQPEDEDSSGDSDDMPNEDDSTEDSEDIPNEDGTTEDNEELPDNNENENLPNNGGGGSSSNGGGNSKPDTESKPENQTGSTTETKPDGTKVETIQKPDGGTVVITTQTNGTVTTVETSNDKTVTTTVEDNNGNKTESIKRADGTETITIQKTDGSNSKTEFDKNGNIKTEVTVTNEAISAAEDKKETITLPMPSLPLAYNKETAPVVNIALPEGTSAKVEIPVEYVTKGTVAVIINADGSEEIVKTTLLTENGIAFKLSQGQSVKIVDNSNAFDDVTENHWGADAVHFASSRELFVGMSEKTFAPNETMTRAMVWTVLARLEGVKDTGERWYHSGRNWAVENGISDGTDEHGEVTREQLSAMLYRYAKLCGYDVSVKSDLGSFEDTEKISDYALEAVQWANAAGIVMGTSDTVLDVHKNSTRAQVAMMLKNFCEKVVE